MFSLDSQNLNPSVIKKLSKEFHQLVKSPPEGITLLWNPDGTGSSSDVSKDSLQSSLTEIYAHLDGPEGTPFERGLFRIKLVLGSDYPQSPPKGYFLTKIFHPNVSQKTGEICVNTLKKDWNNTMGITSVLLTIKCLLMDPNPESALNEEAGKLLLEEYEAYCQHARMMTDIYAKNATLTSVGSCATSNEVPSKEVLLSKDNQANVSSAHDKLNTATTVTKKTRLVSGNNEAKKKMLKRL